MILEKLLQIDPSAYVLESVFCFVASFFLSFHRSISIISFLSFLSFFPFLSSLSFSIISISQGRGGEGWGKEAGREEGEGREGGRGRNSMALEGACVCWGGFGRCRFLVPGRRDRPVCAIAGDVQPKSAGLRHLRWRVAKC